MQALAYYEMYSAQTAARDPKQIKSTAVKFLEAAFDQQMIAFSDDDPSRIKPFDQMVAVKFKKASDSIVIPKERCKEILIGLVVAKGNYSRDHFWLHEGTSNVYVAFPLLTEIGKHGTIQTAYIDEISLLASQKDTNLAKFLLRGGIKIIEKRKKFLFAKGCNLLQEQHKDYYEAAKKDLDLIIACMKANQGIPKTDFSMVRGSLTFFCDPESIV